MSQAAGRLHLGWAIKWANNGKHRLVMHMLSPYLAEAKQAQETAGDNLPGEAGCGKATADTGERADRVWVMWWQGEDGMPELVRKCIHSLRSFASAYEVVLVTKENYGQYITLPQEVVDSLAHIPLTQLSDIIRFQLLNEYGGLWADATLYWCAPPDASYFGDFYTSHGIRTPDPYDSSITKGKWTSYLIGGRARHPVFAWMAAVWSAWYKENSVPADYFMLDYCLLYCYRENIGGFKTYCDTQTVKHNLHNHGLFPKLNEPFDSSVWEELQTGTQAFKLSYKETLKEGDTFYHALP